MKIKFDVTHKELNIIQDIFAKHLCDDCNVWVFGSRAKNTALFNSDLDLAIECKDKIDLNKLNKIKSDLEFSRLPYTVDLIDINTIKPHFKELIQSEMIAFPLKKSSNMPKLRFKGFGGEWGKYKIDSLLKRHSNPVNIDKDTIYNEIGIRSHGKGIFHKENTDYQKLGNKRVFWVHNKAFIVNIVFAWKQAIAITSDKQKGLIASHRFPMYIPKDNKVSLEYMLSYFLRPYGKFLLELASPGGAGRNKTLGQANFNELKISAPIFLEQQKIASFLTSVDKKIELLTQKEKLLKDYKKGIMQKIFSQEIRFKADDGSEFPEWVEKRLGEVCTKKSSNISANTLDANIGKYKVYGATGYLKDIDYYREERPYISIVKDGAGVGRVRLCDAYSSVLGTLDIIKNNSDIDFETYSTIQKKIT